MPESKRHYILKPRRGITSIAPPFKAGFSGTTHVPAQGLGDGVKSKFIFSFIILFA